MRSAAAAAIANTIDQQVLIRKHLYLELCVTFQFRIFEHKNKKNQLFLCALWIELQTNDKHASNIYKECFPSISLLFIFIFFVFNSNSLYYCILDMPSTCSAVHVNILYVCVSSFAWSGKPLFHSHTSTVHRAHHSNELVRWINVNANIIYTYFIYMNSMNLACLIVYVVLCVCVGYENGGLGRKLHFHTRQWTRNIALCILYRILLGMFAGSQLFGNKQMPPSPRLSTSMNGLHAQMFAKIYMPRHIVEPHTKQECAVDTRIYLCCEKVCASEWLMGVLEYRFGFAVATTRNLAWIDGVKYSTWWKWIICTTDKVEIYVMNILVLSN